MNTTRTVLIAASFTLVACAQQGDVAGPAGEIIDTTPPVYEFVQHADPASKPSQSLHRDRTIPEALDMCGNTCMKGWQNAYDFCMGDNPNATSQHCEVVAHDSVATCMNVTCVAAPEDGGRLGECAATCDNEVVQAVDDCMSEHGNPWFCEQEANAIYRTCYDGECRELENHATAAANTWDIDFESNNVAEHTTPKTCEELCEAYDVKIYLQCVEANPERTDLCREAVGTAFRMCVNEHCPAQ